MGVSENYKGLILAVCSSGFIGASFILKKKGLKRAASRGTRAGVGGYTYLLEPLWWVGMVTMITGEAANFVAYIYAPAVLVTPLGALSIIVSSVLAHFLLKERLQKMGVLGCLSCIVGSIVIVIHAPQEHTPNSVQEIWELATQPEFMIYAAATVSVVLALILNFEPRYGQKNMLVYLGICSLMGSLTVMSIKAIGIAIKLTLDGISQIAYPQTWFFVIVATICVVTQLNYLNKALDTFDATIVTPVYYVMFTTLTIIASAIMFKDWSGQDVSSIASEICGFITVLTGTIILHGTKEQEESTRKGSDRFQQNCNSINMDGHDSIMGSDTEAHSGSTPQPLVSNNANMGPPKRKNRSNRSAMWDHFTPMPRVEGVKAANCNYCKTRIQYSGGTSAMRAHLRRCNLYPPNMMMHESASSSLGNREVVVNSSPAVPKFDQEVSRIDLVNMFVALELPFQKVEHPYFRKFVYGLQPKFMLPSRTTLAREILKNWDMEKAKLKSFLSQHCRRVCLTTDTWTSTQNFNYMCLTAHFIDNNWKLQKKVLNFMQVTEYTGEIMAKTVKECLNGWELGRVLSVTVDNASSNDVGIRHLKRWLLSQNGLVSNGEHLHTRCCAHILNLIVKDGLTIVNESILRIRSAVRYVRRTPSRFQRFKKCIDRETITFKGYVGLDCETRWNATYTMANSAFKHMKTFIELEFTDQQYVNEMRKDKGVPTLKDWEEIGSILPFLKIFHDATVRVSGSSYLTSNLYMLEVFSVGQKIAKMCCSEDASLKSMALKMRAKYNKYWGDPNSLNMFLLIAMVLDPRRKLKLVDWMARRIYSSAEAESLTKKIESFLKSIYEEYSGGGVSRLGNYGNVAGVLNEAEDPYELCDFYESDECNTSATELQKYLINENVEEDRPDFDLLEWWKINSSRLPILASIARDVLAIPISTVASESTFSTGGRVLDPYRSSLTPRTVEALICTQDWLDAPFTCFLSSEDLDVIEKIEEDLLSTQDAPSCSASTSITLDDA